jgi:hypothetical protein
MHPTNTEQGMWSLHRRPLFDERERYQVYQIKDVYEEYDHAFGGNFPEVCLSLISVCPFSKECGPSLHRVIK